METVLLIGNPNVGKTTVFNSLTGLRYKVANYPGVTVEKRSACIMGQAGEKFELVDLPGCYSLHNENIDEEVAVRSVLGDSGLGQSPDLIVAVVDACNVERNLFLVSQILDLGVPIIIAVNMIDLAEKNGIKVHTELLARHLGVPVIPIVGSTGLGIPQLEAEVFRFVRASALSSREQSESVAGNLDLNIVKSFRSPSPGRWCSSKEYLQLLSEVGVSLQEEFNGKLRSLDPFGLGSLFLSGPALDWLPGQALKKSYLELARAKGVDPILFEAKERYAYFGKIAENCISNSVSSQRSVTSRLDAVVLHPWWGSWLFLIAMFVVFQSVFTLAGYPMELLDTGIAFISKGIRELLPAGNLQGLLADGIVGGVGSVLVFLPQIAVLYFLIALLENSGYLARVAFLMDKPMRFFGLQGRSFVPILNSFACAIPGIMATRVISSWPDRLRTILIAPLMSCSARLPVYAVLIAAFVPAKYLWGIISLQGLVLFSMYALGVLAACFVSFCFKFFHARNVYSEFMLELPLYRFPSVKAAIVLALDRCLVFLRDAGTVILACSVVLWFLASFPKLEIVEGGREVGNAQRVEASYAGQVGKIIEPIIEPLGFDWRIGVALIASFAAREVFVSTLSLVFNLEDEGEGSVKLVEALQRTDVESPEAKAYNLPIAISLMVFFCFACQCLSTLAVCRRETNSFLWPLVMFSYMTVLAYSGAWIAYRVSVIFFL